MTVHMDKDLFGDPVREKSKKATKARLPLVEEPRRSRQARRVVAYLKRFMSDTAHQVVVGLAAAVITGGVFAGWAQVEYDWIGWSQAEIGEWVTTTKQGE